MQTLNINTSKIDKSALYDGKQGKYLNLTLMENRDGTDQYGNDGFIVQDLGKDRRLAGEKGPIIGNWKHVGQTSSGRATGHSSPQREPSGARSPEYGQRERSANQNGARPPANQPDDDDDIPF